ncbi:hypothetical protein ABG768_024646 [Culter alburnus]|uniref:C-type lectin domain-containing protein n=1 Tax=Culter alburnus TaxID=194366 RepID=A0AAW2AFG7_CULAL
MSWTDAQTYCRQNHTDLASIDDQTDLNALLKTVPNDFKEDMWIGLYRKTGTSPWIWSDQSKSSFQLWIPGQPNNAGGNQFCVYTTPAGFWNDYACLEKFAFICYEKRIQIMRLEVKSNRNVNDPAVKKEILAKIEKILKEKGLTEDAKLSWQMISGGNVFQRMWYQKNNVSNSPCIRNKN